MAKKKKTMKKPIRRLITKVDDVPVTHLELNAIKRQISSVRLSMDKQFKSVDERFESLEAKMDSRFTFMNARFDQLQADIHKVLVTVEEQNARNKVVMDSQGFIQYKLEDLDTRVNKIEKSLTQIK
jgi:hypothetical protein